MKRSLGFRFLMVSLLTLLMFIPMFFVSGVVQDRKAYSRNTLINVGQEWGGEQVISGPYLSIPVEETITEISAEAVVDAPTGVEVIGPDGKPHVRSMTRQTRVNREPIIVYPDTFDLTFKSHTQIRYRGIFKVPVYQADVEIAFNFPKDRIADATRGDEEIQWDKTVMVLNLSNNAALRGDAELLVDGTETRLEPMAQADRFAGILAEVGDPRTRGEYAMKIGLNGAQSFKVGPVGRSTSVRMTSDWADPAFVGGFLPDSSEITDEGFTASWTIPHLARTLPQITREDYSHNLRNRMSFGVQLIEVNDFYQKSYRAAKYAILFIALTFLSVLLIEKGTERPAHPVQYLLIGLAQSIFVLLMVAYAEQMGFTPAYILASAATIGLLTFFGWTGLGLGRRSWVLFALLVVLYAVLYLILWSADFALLAGATLAFGALAATMYFTRNEDWYGPDRSGGLFAKKPKNKEPAPTAD